MNLEEDESKHTQWLARRKHFKNLRVVAHFPEGKNKQINKKQNTHNWGQENNH